MGWLEQSAKGAKDRLPPSRDVPRVSFLDGTRRPTIAGAVGVLSPFANPLLPRNTAISAS